MLGEGSMRLPLRRTARSALAVALVGGFLAVGGLGVARYALGFWRYRGFDPPSDPAYVRAPGTQVRLEVASPALGGRRQEVYVYLPGGYATSGRRYPVIYLLHGVPGRPLAFLETVRMGVVEDSLVSRGRAQPAILVMPFGSTGTFTDKEWVDGASPNQGWGTFVSRDLVRAIDGRYRTIPKASGRAIAGLSEGGYGAIDIALRNPGEFSVVESWSGYERPDPIRSVFGPRLGLLAANDPMKLLPRVAQRLRRQGTYFWFYSGRKDPLRQQNEAFDRLLAREAVQHRYFESWGGHTWALWRANAFGAYLAAATRLARG
jgi:enterochelin esterase-like enzyme